MLAGGRNQRQDCSCELVVPPLVPSDLFPLLHIELEATDRWHRVTSTISHPSLCLVDHKINALRAQVYFAVSTQDFVYWVLHKGPGHTSTIRYRGVVIKQTFGRLRFLQHVFMNKFPVSLASKVTPLPLLIPNLIYLSQPVAKLHKTLLHVCRDQEQGPQIEA